MFQVERPCTAQVPQAGLPFSRVSVELLSYFSIICYLCYLTTKCEREGGGDIPIIPKISLDIVDLVTSWVSSNDHSSFYRLV